LHVAVELEPATQTPEKLIPEWPPAQTAEFGPDALHCWSHGIDPSLQMSVVEVVVVDEVDVLVLVVVVVVVCADAFPATTASATTHTNAMRIFFICLS
jgi:hypothetical protein